MENFLYADLEHAERIKNLINTCIGRETMTFQRSLSEVDIIEKKDFYAREQMRVTTMIEAFKEYKARKAADIKALQKDNEDLLSVIANQAIEVFDQVYLIPDSANNLILFVDKFGEIVHRREMKPQEKQGRLMLPDAEESDVYVEPENKTNTEGFEEISYEDVKEPSGNEVEGIKPTSEQKPKEKRKKSTSKKAKKEGNE